MVLTALELAVARRNWMAEGFLGIAISGATIETISRGSRRLVESSSIRLARSFSSMMRATVPFWAATFALRAASQTPVPMSASSPAAQSAHAATAPIAVRHRRTPSRRERASASRSALSRTSSAAATSAGRRDRSAPASKTTSRSLRPAPGMGGDGASTMLRASPVDLMRLARASARSSSVASGFIGR